MFPVPSRPNISPHRWGCQSCDVLLNNDFRPVCPHCGDPMIPGHEYRDPTCRSSTSSMLEHVDPVAQ